MELTQEQLRLQAKLHQHVVGVVQEDCTGHMKGRWGGAGAGVVLPRCLLARRSAALPLANARTMHPTAHKAARSNLPAARSTATSQAHFFPFNLSHTHPQLTSTQQHEHEPHFRRQRLVGGPKVDARQAQPELDAPAGK